VTGILASSVSVSDMHKEEKKEVRYVLLNFITVPFYFFALLSKIWYHVGTDKTREITVLTQKENVLHILFSNTYQAPSA